MKAIWEFQREPMMWTVLQRRLFATLLIFVSGIAAACAQQPAATDKGTIAKCLDAATEAANFGGQCIGIIADPCMKKADGSASDVKDKKTCAARELAVWNGILADALRQIKAGADGKMNASVTSAQAAWSQSLKTLCPVFNNLDPGMSEGGAEYCSLQETARRALMLKRLGEAVSEH
jgi:Lysozyme inhibitor LprI